MYKQTGYHAMKTAILLEMDKIIVTLCPVSLFEGVITAYSFKFFYLSGD